MKTAQECGLETAGERLARINITETLCLGTELSMSAERILGKMTDEQIIEMFSKNIDVKYLLLDSQGL